MKIAINTCYGGFHLSKQALFLLAEMGLNETTQWGNSRIEYGGSALDRSDPRLISVIEKLGDEASSPGEDIKIVEIPDDAKDWYIIDYDGKETIHEGRTWSYEE